MRTTLLTLAGFCASVASAAGLPSCASSCVTSFGSCGEFDVKCICSSTTLIAGLACCVSTSCGTADQEETIKFANALCAGQGVNDLPQSATCAAGASVTTPTGSAVSSVQAAVSAAATGVSTTATDAAPSATPTGNGAAAGRRLESLGLGFVAVGLLAVL
nr:gpi anchored cfem domain protein c [Quercus suber]